MPLKRPMRTRYSSSATVPPDFDPGIRIWATSRYPDEAFMAAIAVIRNVENQDPRAPGHGRPRGVARG